MSNSAAPFCISLSIRLFCITYSWPLCACMTSIWWRLHRLLDIAIMFIHTHPFNGPFFRTSQVSRYQKGKTNLDFTEARDSEWQWQQLGHMQVCTSLQADKHASTPPLSFLQAGCPFCRPTNSVKAQGNIQSTLKNCSWELHKPRTGK